VLGGVHHLLGGKVDGQQVLPVGAGKHLFEEGEKVFGILPLHADEGQAELADDLSVLVHIAA